MKKRLFIFILAILSLHAKGQDESVFINGTISFISSGNVYVKFSSTAGFSRGDTLYILKNWPDPVLVVQNLSSTSCACKPIAVAEFSTGQVISARITVKNEVPEKNTKHEKNPGKSEVSPVNEKIDSIKEAVRPVKEKVLSGSISVNSYTDRSDADAGDHQRFRYSLSLNAGDTDKGLSAETYMSFSHHSSQWNEVQQDIFNALKIYSLSAKYSFGSNTYVSLGRRINPRMTNIGPSDGLMAERSFKRFSFGLVTGFRPDYTDFGFNRKLFQYGGYASFRNKPNGSNESSLAFMQQMNGSATDRRFIYLQHSGPFSGNAWFFGSVEADLYKLENEKPKSSFNLTGLYLSLRYRVTKNLSLSGSYDARKNVMYYETYRTYLERLIETGMRQGFRFQANYRISGNLSAGISSGYRFLETDSRKSENIYGYITCNNIPFVNASATLSGSYFNSMYIKGLTAGIRMSRDIGVKVSASAGYRQARYDIPEASEKIIQNIAEAEISLNPVKMLSLSASYEGTFEKDIMLHRIYSRIRIRF